jgi:hypothetical protein
MSIKILFRPDHVVGALQDGTVRTNLKMAQV